MENARDTAKFSARPPVSQPAVPSPAAVFALVAGAVWAVGAAVWILASPTMHGPDAIVALTAAVLPLAVAWLALRLAQAVRLVGDVAARQHEMAVMLGQFRMVETPGSAAAGESAAPDAMADRLAALAGAQERSELRLIELAGLLRTERPAPRVVPARPERPVPPDPREAQPALDFPASELPETPALSRDDLIAALQFPADTGDKAGFRALRRALRDPRARPLVTSAQDVLTLLSQDGLYMDDLPSAPVAPDLWRRFAAGERGSDIAPLCGMQDRGTLDAVASRTRQDAIFRDAAHHFLRHFDHALTELVRDATDAELTALAETRTARAFLLLGRVARVFGLCKTVRDGSSGLGVPDSDSL